MHKLQCLICRKELKVGKKLKAKYMCPCCKKEYVIQGHGNLSIDGQI